MKTIRLVKKSFPPPPHSHTSYLYLYIILPFCTTTAASSSVSSTALFSFIDAFFTETIPVKFLVIKKKKKSTSLSKDKKKKKKKTTTRNKRCGKTMNRLASNYCASLAYQFTYQVPFLYWT